MKPSRALMFLPVFLLLAGGLACSRKPKTQPDPYRNMSAAALLAKGELYLQNGKWDEGRKMLRSIEERLPSSPEFAKAKLLIADSFFYGSTSTYPEAVVEYKSFLNYFDFPNEEALIERIIELDGDDAKYLEVMRQPYFHNNQPNEFFNADRLLNFFERIVSTPIRPVSQRRRLWQLGRWLPAKLNRPHGPSAG